MLFVSCKDYDDDINDLRNQITTNATDLTSLVSEKVSNVQTEVTDLETQAAALQAAYEAADEALQATMEASIANSLSSAEGYTDAQTAAANAYTDIQAAAAQAAAIAAAQNSIDAAATSLQASLDAATATLEAQGISIETINSTLSEDGQSIAELQAKIEALVAADATLTEGVATAQARADEAYTLAQSAQSLAENNAASLTTLQASLEALQVSAASTEALNSAIETVNTAITANSTSITNLSTTVDDLSTTVTTLSAQISVLESNTDAADALAQANQNAADIATLNAEIATLASTNAAVIIELQSAVAAAATSEQLTAVEEELTALITANQESITAIQGDITTLRSEAATNLAAAEAYADAAAQSVASQLNGQLSALNGQISSLNTSISNLESAYKTADEILQGNIDDLSDEMEAKITGVYTNLSTSIANLKADLKSDLTEALAKYATTGDLADVKAALKNCVTDDALASKLAGYLVVGSLDAYSTTEEMEDYVAKQLESINSKLESIGDGSFDELLTSIATLKTDLTTAQGDITTLQTQIGEINANLGKQAQRLKSLVLAPTTYVGGIECILFTTLQYEDWGTALEADEAATGKTYSVSDDSHMEEYFVNPSNVDTTSIASLSFVANTASEIATKAVSNDAPIAVAKYNIEENENGVNVLQVNLEKTVSESFGTDPENFTIVALKAVIADEYLTDEEKAAGAEVAVYSDWARLYETSTQPYIHNALEVDENDKLLDNDNAHFWSYSEAYDKGDKTTAVASDVVADHVVIELDYNRTIAFALDSLVLICDKNGNTYDAESFGFTFEFNLISLLVDDDPDVDQKDYAKIIDSDSIVAVGGREAIGHTPMIQAVLKNDGHVVDVRYFEIKWIDVEGVKNYGLLQSDTLDYECAPENGYTVTIPADSVENIYTKYEMTADEFFASYTLKSSLYASQSEADKVAQDKATADANLGTLTENADHSITWTIDYNDAVLKATDADYVDGKLTVEAWGVYQSESGTNIVTFELTLTLDIDPLTLVANHFETMWTSDSKARVVNPQLETDAVYGNSNYETTMMKASLLEGYINDGAVPTDINELVDRGDANFVFDEDKIADMVAAINADIDNEEDKILESDWILSEDGMSLYYQGEPAAVIVTSDENNDYMIQLYEGVDPGNPGEPTEGAKLLIGHYVPVKLVDEWCDFTATLEDYNVNFLTPLAFSDTDIDLELTDITAGGSTGGSEVSLDGTITISEEAVTNHRVVWDNKARNSQTNATLVAWYAVEEPVYDLVNAKTNLQLDGKIGTTCNVLLSKITRNGEQAYRIEYDDANNAFVFYNESGSAISQPFQIDVPVTVKTKWQDSLVATVHITIVPGHSLTVRQK